jgi:hypothetical protein
MPPNISIMKRTQTEELRKLYELHHVRLHHTHSYAQPAISSPLQSFSTAKHSASEALHFGAKLQIISPTTVALEMNCDRSNSAGHFLVVEQAPVGASCITSNDKPHR